MAGLLWGSDVFFESYAVSVIYYTFITLLLIFVDGIFYFLHYVRRDGV